MSLIGDPNANFKGHIERGGVDRPMNAEHLKASLGGLIARLHVRKSHNGHPLQWRTGTHTMDGHGPALMGEETQHNLILLIYCNGLIQRSTYKHIHSQQMVPVG